MQTLHFVVIIAEICFAVAVSDDPTCGSPPEVEHAQLNATAYSYPVGTELAYACEFGYLTEGPVKSVRCFLAEKGQSAEWTEPKVSCTPRSCGDPGFVPNAQQIGFLFTFPNEVRFQCDEGYKLIGTERRFCLASGQWSGKLPLCRRISCDRPKDPENGKAIYSSLDSGSVLRYTCEKGYIYSNKEQRTCSEDGIWTGTDGTCSEGRCDLPQPPAHGSVELLGPEPKIGSIVVYSCDEGRSLNGAEKAKCQDTGEWNFDVPECLEPCKVFAVDHGRIGRYQPSRTHRNQLEFTSIALGTLLKDGEKLFLICDSGYGPAGTTDWQRMFTCSAGMWSDSPRCEPASCLVTPPGTRDAEVKTMNRTHGGSVTYECKEDFEEVRPGTVHCHLGGWVGSPPVCRDTRCYLKTLTSIGLLKSERVYFRSGENYEPECADGFSLGRPDDPFLTCSGGQWLGHFPPCVVAPCLEQPPSPSYGSVPSPKPSYPHGSKPVYVCDEFYYEKMPSSVQCLYGKWAGRLPTCMDSRCYLENLKAQTGVNVSENTIIFSRERLAVRCLDGYRMKRSVPLCLNGEWKEDQTSPCEESPCFALEVKNGALTEEKIIKDCGWFSCSRRVVLEKMAIGSSHSKRVFLTCNKEYGFRGQHINNLPLSCKKGRWDPHPVCLTFGSKYEESTRQLVPSTIPRKHPTVPSSTTTTRSTSLSTTRKTSLDVGAHEIDHQDVDPGSTEKECFCEYPLNDKNVVAHVQDQQLQFGSLVRRGATVLFHCLSLGTSRLVGPRSITCGQCGKWQSSSLPRCADPVRGDTVIVYDASVQVTPEGNLQIQKDETVRFHCFSHGVSEFPVWSTPVGARVDVFNQEVRGNGKLVYSANMDIRNASGDHEGTYSCSIKSFRPNIITLTVAAGRVQVTCAKLEEDEYLRITYSSGQKLGSVASFHCIMGSSRMGVNKAYCQQDGAWSHPPPTCEVTARQNIAVHHCSLASLQQVLPPGIKHMGSNGTVFEGHSEHIACDSDLLLVGRSEALCLNNGTWDFGDLKCISGCAPPMSLSQDSKLIVDPMQDHYKVGDEVMLDCPAGHVLSPKIELIMCLENGWSNLDMPECQMQ